MTRWLATTLARQRAASLSGGERSTHDGAPPRVSMVKRAFTGATPGPWQAPSSSLSLHIASSMAAVRKQHKGAARAGQL